MAEPLSVGELFDLLSTCPPDAPLRVRASPMPLDLVLCEVESPQISPWFVLVPHAGETHGFSIGTNVRTVGTLCGILSILQPLRPAPRLSTQLPPRPLAITTAVLAEDGVRLYLEDEAVTF